MIRWLLFSSLWFALWNVVSIRFMQLWPSGFFWRICNEIESHISKTKENVLISIKTVRKRFSLVCRSKSKGFCIHHIFGESKVELTHTQAHTILPFFLFEHRFVGQCFKCVGKSNESFPSKSRKCSRFCVSDFNWNFRRKRLTLKIFHTFHWANHQSHFCNATESKKSGFSYIV